MEASIDAMKESLPAEQQAEFEQALQLIAMDGMNLGDLMQGEKGAEQIIQRYAEDLDGLTAEEVIAKGEAIEAEQARKKKAQAQLEIEELYQKKTEAEQQRQQLQAFEVQKSRFYKRKDYFGSLEPIIELTVKNGTDTAISRAYFKGTLASPERAVPWLADNFNYEISGGLEPGETTTWKLAPNQFSDWGTVDAPKDAILTVEVLRLDGPDGEELYSALIFGKEEEERLMELLKDYPEFKR
ncbi:MAG: hypothetical protein GVY26_01545 [Bacteroidetes bacterium]|nr:hypothetical protein [Bacteroidota bacterium]